MRAARITVCDEGVEDTIVLLHQGRPLPYRVFARHDLPPRIADDKTVDACVEAALQRQAPARPNPPAGHPWRKPFNPVTAARALAARSGGQGTPP